MDLYQAALAYTARYASSKENLRRVLWHKVKRAAYKEGEEVPDRESIDAEISSILARLEALGAVNDTTYAEAQIRGMKARGTSARSIRAKLAAKGVGSSTIEDVLSRELSEDSELSAAYRLARRRRLGPYRETALSPELRRKDLAALCRAGFTFDIASKVVDSTRDP